MAPTTKPAPTRTPAAQPTVTPLAGDGRHYGAGFARTLQTSERSVPAATRSGEQSPHQSARTITRRPVDGTNSRTVDRASLANPNNSRT